MLIGIYNRSVILTYVGVVSSVFWISFAISQNLKYSIICLIIAGVCDMFDGFIARMCDRTEDEMMFGIEIDSLSDIVNFIALPVAIAYSVHSNQTHDYILYFVTAMYSVNGIIRLAFFNMLAKKNLGKSMDTYHGLPVSNAAVIFPLLWIICTVFDIQYFVELYIAIMFIAGVLFIINFKFRKPSKNFIIFLGILGFISILSILYIV